MSISNSSLRLRAAAAVLAVVSAGCGAKEEGQRAPSPPPVSQAVPGPSGSPASPQRPLGGELPPAGDPRLDDVAYLREQDPDAAVDILIGDYFLRRAQPESALVAYRAAVVKDEREEGALVKLGITQTRLGLLDEAQASYRRALEIDPFDLHAHTNLGNLQFRRGDFQDAVKEYTLATTIDSTVSVTWFNLGLAYEKLEQPNPAIAAYNKATVTDPSDPRPWVQLGKIYYDRGLYRGARERWSEAVKRDPSRTDLIESIRVLQDYADSTDTP